MLDVADRQVTGAVALDGANRRAAFRIEVSCPVTASIDTAARGTEDWERDGRRRWLPTVTEDLSMSGLRLRLPAPLPPRTTLALRLAVGETEVDLPAEVMHSRADMLGAFAGIRFTVIDPPTRTLITRFIAAEERRRLPSVRIMYPAACTFAGEREPLEGSTEVCSPAFVWVLLGKALAPTTATAVAIRPAAQQRIRLEGHVVTCRRQGDLWSTGIALDDVDPTVTAQWSNLVAHLRASNR
jgi:hypothetical protein